MNQLIDTDQKRKLIRAAVFIAVIIAGVSYFAFAEAQRVLGSTEAERMERAAHRLQYRTQATADIYRDVKDTVQIAPQEVRNSPPEAVGAAPPLPPHADSNAIAEPATPIPPRPARMSADARWDAGLERYTECAETDTGCLQLEESRNIVLGDLPPSYVAQKVIDIQDDWGPRYSAAQRSHALLSKRYSDMQAYAERYFERQRKIIREVNAAAGNAGRIHERMVKALERQEARYNKWNAAAYQTYLRSQAAVDNMDNVDRLIRFTRNAADWAQAFNDSTLDLAGEITTLEADLDRFEADTTSLLDMLGGEEITPTE